MLANIETVKEAKTFLRKNFDQGIDCPCCGQFVKKYKRKLNSSMAYALILIGKNRLAGYDGWIQVDVWENPDPLKCSEGNKRILEEILEEMKR